jgi:predicted DNA-binding transcriptional regulator YafY
LSADRSRNQSIGLGSVESNFGAYSHAARNPVTKIAAAAAPEYLRPFLATPSVGAPARLRRALDVLDISLTRSWIRRGREIKIRYRDERAHESERTIWPDRPPSSGPIRMSVQG